MAEETSQQKRRGLRGKHDFGMHARRKKEHPLLDRLPVKVGKIKRFGEPLERIFSLLLSLWQPTNEFLL